jgi:hypothetical protein
MSRPKGEDPARGRRIQLPPWWLAGINLLCGDRPKREICDDLNRLAKPVPLFSLSSVYDFLSGKVTTERMMGAFLVLFPDYPPPIFYATSEAEARRVRELMSKHPAPSGRRATPKITETIEDTGERSRTIEDTGERSRTKSRTDEKTRTRERAAKRGA